jgi:DNA-binding transcriptional LysR family regulator
VALDRPFTNPNNLHMMLPMNELAVFAAVVDAGSLSAAARALGLSKAAVSDQVKRLEERLGARLLTRTTRRVAPTEAGRACYVHCRRMVAEAEAAANSAALFHEQPRGLLRIAAPTTYAPLHIVPALTEFRAMHPQLTVELSLSAAPVDLVAERFDLAVRIGELPDSGLIARRIGVSRLLICAAPAHLSRTGRPAAVEDLADREALAFTPLKWGPNWRLIGPDRTHRNLRMRVVFSTDSGEALLGAALAGMGIALLPNWMAAAALARGELTQVLPEWGGRPVPIQIVHTAARQTPAKVRLFVEHLLRMQAQGGAGATA